MKFNMNAGSFGLPVHWTKTKENINQIYGRAVAYESSLRCCYLLFNFFSKTFAHSASFICIQLESISHKFEKFFLKENLPNFHEVTKNLLLRGGQPKKDGVKQLVEKGVKMIINLRTVKTSSFIVKNPSLQSIHLPIDPHKPCLNQIISFLKIMKQHQKSSVYIHCFHGSDRTGMCAAIWRIVFENWSKEKAIYEMTRGGFGFHAIWCTNLVRFIQELDIDNLRRCIDLEPATK